MGHDGSLYGFVDEEIDDHYVAKLTPSGALVWRSAAEDCTEGAVLTEDDHVIAFSCDSDGGVSELDLDGGTAWTASIAGYVGGNPGVAVDGTIRVAVSEPGDGGPPRLVSVDGSGNILWKTALPWSAPLSLAIASDGTTAVALTANFTGPAGIVAVSPEGNVLWQMTLEATDHAGFQMAIDRAGTLVVTTSFWTLAGFDVETGDQKLSVGSLSVSGPAGPFSIGADGTILAVGPLGSTGQTSPLGLFLLRDP